MPRLCKLSLILTFASLFLCFFSQLSVVGKVMLHLKLFWGYCCCCFEAAQTQNAEAMQVITDPNICQFIPVFLQPTLCRTQGNYKTEIDKDLFPFAWWEFVQLIAQTGEIGLIPPQWSIFSTGALKIDHCSLHFRISMLDSDLVHYLSIVLHNYNYTILQQNLRIWNQRLPRQWTTNPRAGRPWKLLNNN